MSTQSHFSTPNAHPAAKTGSEQGSGRPAGPSPGHVGVFGGVLMSQRRPTRRAWDGGGGGQFWSVKGEREKEKRERVRKREKERKREKKRTKEKTRKQ